MIQQREERIQYGLSTIAFSVVKSRRVKTSEIIVEPDKVTIRTPFNKPVSEIRKLIQKKASWIRRKQLDYKGRVPQIIRPTFLDDSTLPYLGNNYRLKVTNNNRIGEKIELANKHFLVSLNAPGHSNKKIKLLYEKWLETDAEDFVLKKIDLYSKQLGVTIKCIKFRNLRGRWGTAGRYSLYTDDSGSKITISTPQCFLNTSIILMLDRKRSFRADSIPHVFSLIVPFAYRI